MRRLTLLVFLFPFFVFSQLSIVDSAQSLIDKKQYKQAEQLLKTELSKDQENLELIEKLGDVYGHQKKWDDAIVYYEKLKVARPGVANYHYKYGGALGMKALGVSKFKALMYIGDIKKSFIKAIELEPDHIDAHWALIEYYVQIPGIVGGSKRKAIECANHLQKISAVDGFLAKGYIYEYKDDPELAEVNYKMAIKVGGSLNCFQKLTDLYENKTKEPEKAIANIEAAQKKHERNALHYQIGKVCADYNIQLDKGIYCLKEYIDNYTVADGVPVEWAYLRLAQIYRLKENKVKATEWVNKALAKKASFKQAKEEKALIQTL
ncbi:hypothetical protein GWK08_16930 [Leptobacterium flavescens]|uniref:Uncharacterized protein n=1 Tax=Leptobacterium flavescens TaxID=472055 RepID=A0A6P0URG5_9FLAO|nr:hypothetical protein [Leptobacterium flavescens]NER15142.1 hypothetical protein [Leptobacterium flavescens]